MAAEKTVIAVRTQNAPNNTCLVVVVNGKVLSFFLRSLTTDTTAPTLGR